MSEALLYDISQQLRLLARRDCQVGRHGHLISGAIDQPVEAARLKLLDVLERFQDYQTLEAEGLDIVAYCQKLAWQHRHQITALRRDAEFQQQLEVLTPKPIRFEYA